MIRRGWLLAAFALMLWIPPAARAELAVVSETLLRTFERARPDQTEQTVLPAYEYLTLTAGAADGQGLSLHMRGWGRSDLGGSDYYAEQSDGELLYGYLEYARSDRLLDLRLGRQQLFDGIASETLDGLRLTTEGRFLSLLAYGGQPAAFAAAQGRSGDSLYGGRIGLRFGTVLELGLSAKESRNDGATAAALLGGDLSLALPAGMRLSGYSTYNRDTSGWREHAYQLHLPAGPVTLRPFFERYAYADYFDAAGVTAPPFRRLAASDITLTTYGVDLAWLIGEHWEGELRTKIFNPDQDAPSAHYFGMLLAWRGSGRSEIGIEGGTMVGKADEDQYLLGRLFFYRDRPFGLAAFLSGDLGCTRYQEPIFGEDLAWQVILAAGRRFLADALEISLSGDYSRDPYFEEDVKGMLALLYHFSAGRTATKGAHP